MNNYYLGVDVGGTKAAYGLYDENGRLVYKTEHLSDTSLLPEEFFDLVIEQIQKITVSNQVAMDQIKGIGIGMPSFIIYKEGYIVLTSNLTKIKNFAAKEYLEQNLSVPTFLDNDANIAALAEHRLGAGRGQEHMLYCAVGTGIANGIIINGNLFRGSYGWAGESGHALITPDEDFMCGCENNGCLMSHTSGSMIVRRVLREIENGRKTIMTDMAGDCGGISCKTILDAYGKNDELAVWAIDHMAKYLAVWLFNLYQTLNINCFVLGGGLTNFGDVLFDKVFEQFNAYNHNEYPVYFKYAEMKENFGIRGAALLAESETNI